MKHNRKEKIISIIDKAAFFFFGVLVFFLPISKAAIESVFGFIFLCFILRSIFERPTLKSIKSFFKNKINLAVLIFYICIGLSALASAQPLLGKSLGAWFFKWGEGVLLFYFAQVFLTKKKLKVLLTVMAASAFLVCIDGLYQKTTGVDFMRGFGLLTPRGEKFAAVRATFSHYNDFATYLIVMFFVCFGLVIDIKKVWVRISVSLICVLIISNIVLTFSRGAWVSFLAVFVFLGFFFKDKKIRVVFLIFLFLFIIGIIGPPFLRERFLRILGSGADEGRFGLWKSSFMMFKSSPLLGKGLGLFMDYIHEYSTVKGQYAHNCYIQILAETGLLGLLSFLWVISLVLIKGLKKIYRDFEYIFMGLFAGLLAFLAHSFFDTQLYSLQLSILFWVMLSFVTIFLSKKGEDYVHTN